MGEQSTFPGDFTMLYNKSEQKLLKEEKKNTNHLLFPFPDDFPKTLLEGHYVGQQCTNEYNVQISFNHFFARYLAAEKRATTDQVVCLGSPCMETQCMSGVPHQGAGATKNKIWASSLVSGQVSLSPLSCIGSRKKNTLQGGGDREKHKKRQREA